MKAKILFVIFIGFAVAITGQGRTVEILFKDVSVVSAELLFITEDTLFVNLYYEYNFDYQQIEVTKYAMNNILQIKLPGQNKLLSCGCIGGGVGLGLFAALFLISDAGNRSEADQLVYLLFTGLITAATFIVGAIIGSISSSDEVIFEITDDFDESIVKPFCRYSGVRPKFL